MKAMIKMRKELVLMLVILFFAYGCSKEYELETMQEASLKFEQPFKKASHGKVIHRVVVGSKDNCQELNLSKGCKGNLSLVANVYEDGSVSGQWQDTFSNPTEGIHVKIDCVDIEFTHVGPFTFASAIIGGFITKGKIDGQNVSGQYALVKALDSDYLTDGDRPVHEDFISLSYISEYQDCKSVNESMFSVYLFSKGQVKIW